MLAALLWPHARAERGLLVAGAGLALLVVALRVAQPWPLKWILDFLTGHSGGPLLRAGEAPVLGVLGLSVLYLVMTLAAAAAEYGQLLVLAGLGNRILNAFRAQVFAHLLRQPLRFHEGREAGELLTRVVYDTARLRQGVNGLLTRVVQTVALFLATGAVLLWLDWRLAAVVAASGLVALWSMARSNRRIVRAARRQRLREGRLAALVAEDLLGIREVQTFRGSAGPDQRFFRQSAKGLKQEQKVRRLAATLTFRVELLLALAVTLILWLGARAVQAASLSPGDLVLFVTYAVGLYRPFSQFARQTARSGRTFACAERLVRIMSTEPAVADRPGAVVAPTLRGELRFEGVSVTSPKARRGARKWRLRETSFAIAPGERVAVLGANGAGKSTLLRLVLRLADPSGGAVLLDGRDLRDYTISSLRPQISVVFQDSVLFGLSVRENIALGNPTATLEEVETAARRANTAALIERLPQGYETPVRQRGALFSAGERQRLALARALLRDGRVWLLDEPTTGLDADTSAELLRILLEVTRGRTVLWVTHDPAIVTLLDRVLVLEEGAVAFTGSPEAYGRWLAQRVSVPIGAPAPEA